MSAALLFPRLQHFMQKLQTLDPEVFSVLQFAKSDSVISVSVFWVMINTTPWGKNIWSWYYQFQMIGCVDKGKSTGWPTKSEENVDCQLILPT